MKHWLITLILLGAALATTPTAEAGQPGYLILRTHSHHGRWAAPRNAHYVDPAPYAWGYFGAQRHTNSFYHRSFNGDYWQRTDW